MKNDIQILIDSDAFIGWMLQGDAHYETAGKIFEHIEQREYRAATTSAVVAEVASFLSHRIGQDVAKIFLNEIIDSGDFPIIFVDEALHDQGLEVFKQQDKKRTSYVDCVNVAVCQYLNIPTMFSFDKVYSKTFGIGLADEMI